VSLRLTSCYGPGMNVDSVLPYFAKSAIEGRKLTWFGTGARSQNFVHVRDVTRALLLAAESTATGVINIGGAESTSMKDLAQLIVKLTGSAGSAAEAAGKPDPQDDLR
jgi:UDP-glucose 4-epimerase